MKRCSCCGETKPFEAFNRNRSEKDGLQRWCKDCRRKQARQVRQEHHAERLAKEAERRKSNKGKLNDRSTAWRRAHPDRIKEQQEKSRCKHGAQVAERNAAYREAHRAEHQAANREWYCRNRQRYNDYAHRRRARQGAPLAAINRLEVFNRDGWVCQICGRPVNRELEWPDSMSASLDHIEPLFVGGAHTKDNVQLAHLVCNLRKHTALVYTRKGRHEQEHKGNAKRDDAHCGAQAVQHQNSDSAGQ